MSHIILPRNMVTGAPGLLTDAHEGDAQGAIRYIANAYPDEPLVVIRGRDALAVPVLMGYSTMCAQFHLHGQGARMEAHAARFIEWQRVNAKMTHLPDPLPAYAADGTMNEDASPFSTFTATAHDVRPDPDSEPWCDR